jgi:hypothetical protein
VIVINRQLVGRINAKLALIKSKELLPVFS